jgi:glycine/D-amino acid oxidase-like deaminating enzyme
VGAGFAGLSTALELKALGADVVVLEREFAGFGASGRNAGYLVGAGGLDYGAISQALGRERAKTIITFFEDSVAYVERKLGEYGIDCDYIGSGLIGAAVHPSQEKMLHAKLAVGADLGVPARFLDSAEMRTRGIPPAFLCGSLIGGGILDPGKYVLGLRRAAIGAGVRLYENTALLSFQAGPTVRCRTAKGSVSARHLVLATNADTPQLGVLKRKVTPVRVSAIETQPLSKPQLESLGWSNREGITTKHLVMESHRLTARNTVVVTTKHLGYEFGSQTPNVQHNEAYRALASVFYQRFPTLRDVAIQACWSGYISTTDDGLPAVGAEGPGGNILYAAGCNGHGVGSQSHTGKLLAEHIRGAPSPVWAALQHETPVGLPEPLRWFTMRSKFSAAHRLDDRLNRTVRAPAAR